MQNSIIQLRLMKSKSRLIPTALNRITKIALIGLIAITNPACTAEQSRTETPAGDTQETPTQTAQSGPAFLWSVKSSQNTVYLLGSVHLLQAKDYPLPAALDAAYEDAEKLIFEIDLKEAKSPDAQQMILKKATAEQGQTLQSTLNPDTYQLAEEKAKELGLPIQAMASFEPWFFSLTLLTAKLGQLGFQAKYGVDQHYYERAQKDGKEILALETIAEQISLFDNLKPSDQDEYVRQTLVELDTLSNSMTDIVSAWKSGNPSTLENLLFESFERYPKMRVKFFDERNQNWMKTLVPLLQKQDDYLVIVGAGHLVGENNVLQLLKEKGYSADQL